ncbi:hypothetical protein [Methylobacterium sp. NFXW15]|uniref:hypothetical protein n=1 Tax=Methylobacterium sp. NFXW15 TaxID=2819512 RepID=UPI003CF57CEB
MSTEVLKEFLIAVGFKPNESAAKRTTELIAGVEKQLVANDKAARERDAAEKARVAAQTLRAAEVASSLRMVGVAVAGFATVAGAAMGALAVAIKNTIGEFDRLYYISGRSGASVNNLKALGYAFAQTGSSAEAALQAVDNFARARRSNPGIDGLLRSYGVSTQGDSSEVLSNALDAVTKRHPQYTSQQIAGLFGISPDEVDHWVRYRKEIAQFDKQYKDLQRTFGVNGGEMARASTSISRAMGEFSAVIEVLKNKLVSFFLPAIEAVAKGMTDLLNFLTNDENVAAFAAYFDKPIAAIKELINWVKVLYDQFVVLFEYVRNSPIGKLLGGINPGYFREKFLDFITPLSAQAATNGEGDTTAKEGKPGIVQRGVNAVKRALGLGGSMDGMQARAPEAAGKYRPVYALSDADLSQRTADIIAGEAIRRNPESIDAVINNMMNRVGSKGWGPSKNLLDVATAPGQYEAAWKGSKANASETEFIQSRIRAIASGGVPDNTNGSNAYRAGSYRGPWYQKHRDAPVIGGNRFAYEPGASNGPYAPYRAGADAPKGPPAPRFSTTPNTFNPSDYMRSQPMGSTSTSNDNSRTVSQNNPVTVNINGASDPQATASAVTRGVGQAHDMSLRNVQTAIR